MNASVYWYDFETTGIDPIADRPLQFAGVRTDIDLNEIAEPQNFLCKPGDDVIPNPEALLVTGIMMSDIEHLGMSERDFAAEVLRQFSVPQTCVAGFNSLRFDDEFTRQMFYRNFYDPYAREWRSGNSRWDVIDLFRTAYALRPEGIKWPESEPGVPSFRLEDIARANGLAHIDAHDALADVRATIEVTRLLRQAQPKLYDYLFALRDKKAVLQQLYPLGKQPIVHVSVMYPASQGCTAVVLPICQHPTNNNAVICFDLSQSPEVLSQVNPAELARLVFSKSDDLAEDEQRVALKTIQINRCPSVAPLATLGESGAARLGIDLSTVDQHMQILKRASGLVEKIQEVFSQSRFDSQDDPDYQLYDGGFFSDADRDTMTTVTEVSFEKLESFTGRFQDQRLDEMLFRYRARNFPESLNEQEHQRWNHFRADKWQASGQPKEVLAKISSMLKQATDETKPVLEDLKRYVDKIVSGL
jgi:exodeoxyribonuclease-1